MINETIAIEFIKSLRDYIKKHLTLYIKNKLILVTTS